MVLLFCVVVVWGLPRVLSRFEIVGFGDETATLCVGRNELLLGGAVSRGL